MSNLKVTKGQSLSVTKNGIPLEKVRMELHWSPPIINSSGHKYDFDISVLLMDSTQHGKCDMGKSIGNQYVCYFGQKVTPVFSHTKGDSRDGAGVGADEIIVGDLTKIPADCDRIPAFVTLYEANLRKQSFDHCGDTVAKIYDDVSGAEIATIPLAKLPIGSTSALLGVFYRIAGGWEFKNLSTGYVGQEISDFFELFGCD